MNKILQRLLVFVIGLPSVLSIVFFFPQMHHLAANIAVIAASAIGAVEFAEIAAKRGYSLPNWEAAVLGAVLPMAATLRVSFGLQGDLELYAIVAAALWILSSRVLSRQSELASAMDRVVSAFATMMYPGALMFWIVRISTESSATVLLLLFLIMVFGNDSMAWATGMLFGKGNRGIISASPNKSIAGFIGGLATSVLLGVAAAFLFPGVFISKLVEAPLAGALLGLFCGLGTIIGDLAESTMKRSADVKDSGIIIPGRGGLLDSIDSIAFSAPIFFAVFNLLFQA